MRSRSSSGFHLPKSLPPVGKSACTQKPLYGSTYPKRRDHTVFAMSESNPLLMPGSRLVMFGLDGSGQKLLPLTTWQAWSGVPMATRPSMPTTHVGFVASRCWLKIAQSRPKLMVSMPLRVGLLEGTLKSCPPAGSARICDATADEPLRSPRLCDQARMTGMRMTSAKSW